MNQFYKEKLESERDRTQKTLPYIAYLAGTLAILTFIFLMVFVLSTFN